MVGGAVAAARTPTEYCSDLVGGRVLWSNLGVDPSQHAQQLGTLVFVLRFFGVQVLASTANFDSYHMRGS